MSSTAAVQCARSPRSLEKAVDGGEQGFGLTRFGRAVLTKLQYPWRYLRCFVDGQPSDKCLWLCRVRISHAESRPCMQTPM